MLFKIIYLSIYIINWIFLFFQEIEYQPNCPYQSASLWRSSGIKIFVSGLKFYNIYQLKGLQNLKWQFGSNYLWNTLDITEIVKRRICWLYIGHIRVIRNKNVGNWCQQILFSKYLKKRIIGVKKNTISHTNQSFFKWMCICTFKS